MSLIMSLFDCASLGISAPSTFRGHCRKQVRGGHTSKADDRLPGDDNIQSGHHGNPGRDYNNNSSRDDHGSSKAGLGSKAKISRIPLSIQRRGCYCGDSSHSRIIWYTAENLGKVSDKDIC